MKCHTISLPNVTPLKLVTAKATYGIGFLTAFVGGFCSLFGLPNNMYTAKIQKAETLAMNELDKEAASIGADGVMDVRCQIDGLSFFVSGTAYKWPAADRAKRKEETAKQPILKAGQTPVKKESAIAPKDSEKSVVKTPDSIKKESNLKEAPRNMLPCPQCGEDLSFMGWGDEELHATQTCPLCGKEILLKK